MNHRALAFVALSSLFTSSAALAQPAPAQAAPPPPTAAPAEGADAHFRRGIELSKEADYNAALIEFRRAYEIDPRFQALYNIAQTYDQLQDYANALKTMEKYLADGGAQISAGRREEVQKTIERLRTRVANVEITTNVPDVEISIDDLPSGKTPLPGPVLVSAGRRKITANLPGKPPVTQIVELAGGDVKKIALVVAVPVDTPAPNAEVVVPKAPWVITGLLAAAAVATGAAALDASSTLKTDLGTAPMPMSSNAALGSQISSDHSKTFALALTTDVLIGTAVAAAVVSVVLTVRANRRAPGDERAAPPPAGARRDGGPRLSVSSPFASGRAGGHAGDSTPFVRLGAGPQSVLLSGAF